MYCLRDIEEELEEVHRCVPCSVEATASNLVKPLQFVFVADADSCEVAQIQVLLQPLRADHGEHSG